ncbi:hypothetical protein E2C01_101272 [Portunus trituberculatus]|uniref:Uncharacterized protein n=1 Tax=Portunus trituberculatus TaxID=210409 RepID=A0A5B7KLJ8_PORTR|nr:hypothetical protein [Portunus trituberculatus]
MDCDLVNKCLDLIHTLEGAGAMVHFTWIPSQLCFYLWETHRIMRQGGKEAQIATNTFGRSVLLMVCVVCFVLHQGDTLYVTI